MTNNNPSTTPSRLKVWPTVTIYRDTKEEWRWQIKAANGNIIGASTEGYKNKVDCVDNLRGVSKAIDGYLAL